MVMGLDWKLSDEVNHIEVMFQFLLQLRSLQNHLNDITVFRYEMIFLHTTYSDTIPKEIFLYQDVSNSSIDIFHILLES